MRVMEKRKQVILKLEDKGSNELFAACPIDTYPGPAIGNFIQMLSTYNIEGLFMILNLCVINQ